MLNVPKSTFACLLSLAAFSVGFEVPSGAAARQVCEQEWLQGDGVPGVNGGVLALTTFDPDGFGPQTELLIVGGQFSLAGSLGADNIAAWDGASWRALGAGFDGTVLAAISFDPDDPGPQVPQLIVAGSFMMSGSAAANRIARWEGAAWQQIGTGMNSEIRALTTYDADGDGPLTPVLVAGGSFTTADGIPANRAAYWNGTVWAPLGTGFEDDVNALTTWDSDGAGPLPPVLFAGGDFSIQSTRGIARWDPRFNRWSPLGVGLNSGLNDDVFSLASFDPDGLTGPQVPQLIVGGTFTSAGGVPCNRVARWDASAWHALGTGVGGRAESLGTFDPDASGPILPQLIASGSFTTFTGPGNFIARWDGTVWHPLGEGTDTRVTCVAQFDPDGVGPLANQLMAGGTFSTAGGKAAAGIAGWDGAAWRRAGTGFNQWVTNLIDFDPDGEGMQVARLIAGGRFTSAGSAEASHIAAWDGASWHSLGAGLDNAVQALCSFDPDGAGPTAPLLIAADLMPETGKGIVNPVERWDGTSWEPLGAGMDGEVLALKEYDPDGPGPTPRQLIAGGVFSMADGHDAATIARWDGVTWHPLGSGTDGGVLALMPFDQDADGPLPPSLIAGGQFKAAGGAIANHVARWNGTTWSPLGVGMNEAVNAFVLYDTDGIGPQLPQLIAGGTFTEAGGSPANFISRWDGTSWFPLGPGLPGPVHVLALFDPDGNGPLPEQLIAGGELGTLNGINFVVVASWDGTAWTAVGTGIDDNDLVSAVASFDPDGPSCPTLPRLCIGGRMSTIDERVSVSFAQRGSDTMRWTSAIGGAYPSPLNWDCGRPPTPFDRLVIDGTQAGYKSSSFQVTLPVGNGHTKARTLSVRTDTVTLDLNGNPFTLTGGSSEIDDPGLVVGELASQPGALVLKNSFGGAPVDFTASALSLADQPTSAARLNRVTVQDAATRLVVNGQAFIGRRGNEGQLTVQSGGDAVLGGTLSVADQVGSVGKVDVNGSGSTLIYGSLGTSAGIGVNGVATLDVSSGGVLASAAALDSVTVGTLTGAQVNATITGAGSTWSTQQNDFAIGYAGDVVAGIAAGGQLLTNTADEVYVSRFRESGSTLTLRDSGSRWRESTAPIRIGPSGTIDVGAGTAVECPAMVVTEGGFLTGVGQVRGLGPTDLISIQNGGTISPRAEVGGVGVLTINGNLTQSASRDGVTTAGTIAADLAGTGPGQADRIDLGGSAVLSGALRVRLTGGFDPPAGSRFTVLTAVGGITGRFDVMYMPGLAGRFMRVDYVTNAQRVVTSVDVVVESQSARGTFDPSGYTAPGAPSAADLGDLDGDGFADLVLTIPDAGDPEANPGQVAVLINAGNTGNAWNGFVPSSQVTFNTGRAPSSVVIARLRGNTQPNDIAVACAGDDSVQTFTNSGLAVFTSAGIVSSGGLRPLDVDAADFTGDGVVDLAVANYGDINPPPEQQLPDRGNARVLSNDGSGTFTPADTLVTGWYPRSLAIADFDGAGSADIATADSGTSEISVFMRPPGGGSGFLQRIRYVTIDVPVLVEPGGLDNPKELNDLTVVFHGSPNSPQTVGVLLNTDDGIGTLTPVVALDVGGAALGLVPLDLDDDADQDICVIVSGGSPGTSNVRLLRNNTPANSPGGIVLALEPTPLATNNPSILLAGDVDNDGREDLVTINNDAVLLGAGAGGEVDEMNAGGVPGPQRVAVARALAAPPACLGDLNGDSSVNTSDLVVFLSAFGQSVPANTQGDLNGDGAVNTADLVVFLGRFGQACR